jgi:hypothetical protein
MTKLESARAYLTEPTLAALILSSLINYFGMDANAKFMHGEARDVLSLSVVLLAAALALWVGLFWVANSDFGRWLESKKMLEPINSAYVASAVVLLCNCVFCILCAHVDASYHGLQLTGEFVALWGIATMLTLLSNTRNLLRLHGLYGSRPKAISEIKAGVK